MTGLTTALPFLRGALLGLKQGVRQRHILPDSFHAVQASFAGSRIQSFSLQACSSINSSIASTLYVETAETSGLDWLACRTVTRSYASSADAMNATISSSKVSIQLSLFTLFRQVVGLDAFLIVFSYVCSHLAAEA